MVNRTEQTFQQRTKPADNVKILTKGPEENNQLNGTTVKPEIKGKLNFESN